MRAPFSWLLASIAVLAGCTEPQLPLRRAVVLGADASPIGFDRMAKFPEPGWNVPRMVAHAPDGKLVTFLASEDGSDVMTLFSFDRETRKVEPLLRAKDLAGTEAPRSREEELRRERQRQRSEGITSYRWAKRAPVMVIPFGGDIFVRSGGTVERLTTTKEPELDPRACASGERVAFVRGSELGVVDVKTKKETMLTAGAPEGITRGQQDFNGQEELGEESGYLWAPACDRLFFVEVDERKVDEVPILGWRDGRADLMMQRYPRAGAKNPVVRAGFVDVKTRETKWISWPDAAERYLVAPHFSEDGKTLWVQAIARDQKRLTLFRVDVESGKAEALAHEASDAWVDRMIFADLPKSGELLVSVVVAGHVQLQVLRASDGARLRTLTGGDGDVNELVAVDEEKGRALFTATASSPLEFQLFAVPLAGGPVTRLTKESGVHAVRADEHGRSWVDVHSAHHRLPHAEVFENDAKIGDLPIPVDADLPTLRLQTPDLVEVKGPGGEMLHGALWKPREDGRKHPAIVNVYGGPGVQLVQDRWAPHLFAQHMAQRGFYVFELDNRGSAGRGPAFAQKTHKQLGKPELEDQLAGLDWLLSHHPVDPKRVGIQGHSYGGYMAVRAMLKAPGRFAAGAAMSPVTDWALYDTGYTERFMETPASNPSGYEDAQLWRDAGRLTGSLLLVHANMDENVHYTNTARLVESLVAAGKTFDLLVLPGERHGYRNPKTRAYVLERAATFFATRL